MSRGLKEMILMAKEEGKKKLTKDKLFVIGVTALLLIFGYSYIKKEYDKSLTLGESTVEAINDKDPEAMESIKDLPLDLQKAAKDNKK